MADCEITSYLLPTALVDKSCTIDRKLASNIYCH